MKIQNGKNYDLVVIGCGSAGFCAAVQAGRLGLKTAVIESHGCPGGIMTVGGNNDVAQFYAHHKQIIRGIGWEFITRLNAAGYAPIPDMSVDAPHWYYGIRVHPAAAAYMMDTMLTEAGVDIYYEQRAVECETEQHGNFSHISSVIISSKNGLVRLTSKMFADTSGDGDFSVFAGAEYECGDTFQPGTLRYFINEKKLSPEKYGVISERLTAAVSEERMLDTDTMLRNVNSLVFAEGCNVNHISGNGTYSDGKTAADIEGRRSVYRLMNALGNDNFITAISPETAMRETRRILCDGYITCKDYVNAADYVDSVCYSFYPIDLHRDGMENIYQIFLDDGKVPKIPLSAMIVRGCDNLYVAGRCASGDRLANSAYRVKASCMAMGQAAAAAAYTAIIQNSGMTRGCDISKIRSILADSNALVPGFNSDL